MNNKGQIGPMTLEDVLPMLFAVIISFIFVAFLYTLAGHMLEQRNAEAMQRKAYDVAGIIISRSPLLFNGTKCLLEQEKLDSYDYSGINAEYGAKGYDIAIEIKDLSTGKTWPAALPSVDNAPVIAYPVAIRYGPDNVREGILKVQIRRTH